MTPKHLQTHPLLPPPPSTFSCPVHLLPLYQSRHLSLHGPLIILSKPSKLTKSKLLHLNPSSPPFPVSKNQVKLSATRLSFPSSAIRDSFLRAAKAVLQHTSRGLADYHLGPEIGRGASASVYLTRRKSDGALFAMKTLPKSDACALASDLESVLLERAVLSDAARRCSPFVVGLADCFETGTHLCFVTELAEYGALRRVLVNSRRGRLSQGVARRLFAEIVLGLEEIHRMGYLYRDMKPGNVLVTKTGHVKVADFGVAKKMRLEYIGSEVSSEEWSEEDEEESNPRLVGKAKSFVGTRRYMAPEMLEMKVGGGGEGYGVEADIWGLGVTLYVMVVGRYPFGGVNGGGDTAKMAVSIRDGELKFPGWIGEELRDLIEGMLRRNVRDRMDLDQVKRHQWLKGIDWSNVRRRAERNDVEDEVVSELGTVKEVEFEKNEQSTRVVGNIGEGAKEGLEITALASFSFLDWVQNTDYLK